MELYVYHDDIIAAPAVIDEFSSLRWRRKYFEPGEFELHVKNTELNRMVLIAGAVIKRADCVETPVIETVNMQGYELTVSGRMYSKNLEGKIVRSLTFSGPADQAMQQAVHTAASWITIGSRPGVSDAVSLQTRWHTVLEIVQSLARAYGLGFRMVYSWGKSAVFEVYAGQNRPDVLFSNDFDNVMNPVYTYSEKTSFTCAYVAGEGEGDARKYVVVGSGPAIYVDARDLQQGSQTDEQYLAQLRQRGIEKLAVCVPAESFECDVVTSGYRSEWDLGDIVKVQYTTWGILMDKRITEVEEIYENGVPKVVPVFGTPLAEKLSIGD